MKLHMLNILMPLAFLAYQIIIDSVNLFPFNDVKSKDKRLRKYEILGNYPPLLIIAWCFYYHSTTTMWIGFVMTTLIVIMHLMAWWIPYFTGYPKNVKDDYNKYFLKTFKFLPKIKDHILPDAEHVGVGILLVITFILQIIDLFL